MTTKESKRIPVHVINLDHRTDRLRQISAQLDALGVQWSRFSAVDGAKMSDDKLSRIAQKSGVFGTISKSIAACFLSHQNLWQQMVEEGHEAIIILEDDILLAPQFADFCLNSDWVPPDAGSVKFEKHTKRVSKKLMSRRSIPFQHGRYNIHELFSTAAGAGGYLITRQFALAMLAQDEKIDMPVDHKLFNPNVSKTARKSTIYQIVPAVTIPSWDYGTDIDIRKKKTLGYRLKRGFFEVNLLPWMLWLLLAGRAKMVKLHYSITSQKDCDD